MRFVWGGYEKHKKVNLISWDTVQRPIAQGGMSFTSARQANMAFLTTLVGAHSPNHILYDQGS